MGLYDIRHDILKTKTITDVIYCNYYWAENPTVLCEEIACIFNKVAGESPYFCHAQARIVSVP
jgi:hypothetical protein